jgi:hypothetical protein
MEAQDPALEFVAGLPVGQAVLERLRTLVDLCGGAEERVGRSQVAFRQRRGFAYLWRPGQYLAHPGADLVVSIALGRRVDSARFKQVVQVSPHHWMHHLEVRSAEDLDEEVAAWLAEAAREAGGP